MPRDLPTDGLSLADLAQLGMGESIMERTEMDQKLREVMTSILAAVGAVVVYGGFMNEAMWAEFAGGAAMVMSFMWTWLATAKE